MNNPFFFFDESINSELFFDLVLILLQKPNEDHLAFAHHHLVDVLDGLSKLPVLIAILHEFVKEFEFDFFLITDDLLQNVHEFTLF